MNKKLPEIFLGKFQLMGTIAFSVLFAVVFLTIYVSFSDSAIAALGSSGLFLFMVLFVVVTIIFLSVSRILMYYSRNWFKITYFIYVVWCLLEIVSICVFYTVLTIFVLGPENVDPWYSMRTSLLYGSVPLIIPYLISGLYLGLVDRNRIIRRLASMRSEPSSALPVPQRPDRRISFYDTGGTMKLSLNASDLYYIESEDNYIKVWYMDGENALQSRLIRCRLKTVEANFTGTSLVRCSRKYIVNTDKVKVLSKETGGYFLDMGNPEIPRIDVTKTYQANVLSRFDLK